MTKIELEVNGRAVTAEVSPRTSLADLLREQLLLTGTHIGCEHGICGACTVEIDGEIARSCITYAVSADGARVRTIEGFDDDPDMARLRQAFTQKHALQCGYCTPGMLIAARDLVRRRGRLTRPEIRHEMSGNLCRCTGYMGIVDAIEQAMAQSPTPASVTRPPWLGPAPGPDARAAAAVAPAPAASARPAARRSEAMPVAAANRPRIAVATGALDEDGEFTRLSQSFVLHFPRAAVWSVVADAERLARCLPGAVLDGPPADGKVTGRMEVALGPITVRLAGEGRSERDDAGFRHVVSGQGSDRASASRARGRVEIALAEAALEATRVDIAIAYALTGPLAQFSRASLVHDVVARIGQAFAQNLDASLASPEGAPLPAARLGAVSLLWAALKSWLARRFSAQR